MILNNIDLNKIKVFHSVVRNGGYRQAGEELGLTRSAISQSITTLEAQLGVPLFQRKGRKLFPTQSAKLLSKEYEKYEFSLISAIKKTQNNENLVEGTVRIGAYYEFAKSQLTPLIQEFCDSHPNANFRFHFDSPSRLQESIEQGKIDMSFSIFPHKESQDVESIKVFKQELVLIAPKHLEKQAQKLKTLLDLPIIEYYQSHQLLPRWIRAHFSNRRPKLSPRVFAASAEMLIKLVEQGLGIGVAPLYLLKNKKNIRIVRPTEKKLLDHIWLNQFKGQFENSAHESFYTFIQNKIK